MILRVNGEDKTFSQTITTVHQLLDVLEINPKLAAVEINVEIVDPQLFSETTLHDKDKIEIVSFVGGGYGGTAGNCRQEIYITVICRNRKISIS